MKTNYQQQANDFLIKTETEFICEFLKNDFHFSEEKEKRDIYQITLKRKNRKYTFNFGQSILKSQYYKDKNFENRRYSMTGANISGGFKITNLKNYMEYLTLIKGVPPNPYDVLTCLQKNDVGTFEEFCNDFGYDIDSKKAENTYNALYEEYKSLCALFSDSELQELQEIN